MFAHHSSTVTPMRVNLCPNILRKIDTNYRFCLKLILSALIPLMIGIFTIVITLTQQQLANKQRERDKQDALLLRIQSDHLANILRQESILITYLNDVSNFLLSENHTKMLIHIRTKTLTSLRQLDIDRKRYLFLYLYESNLLYQEPDEKNITALKISGADFNGIQFNGTKYFKCIFVRIYLYDVYLSDTYFNNCYIDRSNFSYSKMLNANFFRGLLIRISFKFTLLDNSYFCNMKLSIINFSGATLVRANFSRTVWDKGNVDFTNANLTGAILSNIQLRNSTLNYCILPNRTWGPIPIKNLVINGDLEHQNCTFNDGEILKHWNVYFGEFRVFQNHTKCYFRIVLFNTSKNFAYIGQTINLENYSLLISSGNAKYNISAIFQCIGTHYATITIRHVDENGLVDAGVSNETVREAYLQSLILSDNLRQDTRFVRIIITIFRSLNEINMNTTMDENYCVCYNVKYVLMKKD